MEKTAIYGEGLSRLIQCPTVSNSGDAFFVDFRKVLAEVFPLLHKNTECVKVFENSLLYKWKGKSDAKPVVLMGHQDVVPADGANWKYPPFGGVIADGKVWGRGAMDCKGTVYCVMQAVEELIAEGVTPDNDVYISTSDCEEVFGQGATEIKNYLKEHGVKPYLVLDEGGAIIENVFKGIDRPFAVIGLYEKGYADVKFVAKSAGGHSSTPPKSTPMARLAAFVNDVETHDYFKTYLPKEAEEMLTSFAPALPGGLKFVLKNLKLFKPVVKKVLKGIGFGRAIMSTTCCFTMSGASDAPNVIPQEAYVIANLRYSKYQNGEESVAILKKVAEKYDIETQVLNSRDASRGTTTDNEGYKFLKDTVTAEFPDYGVAPYIILGGTDCRYFEDICDCALRFTPLRLSEQQLAAMHASDENVDISALAEGVGFFKRLILNNK